MSVAQNMENFFEQIFPHINKFLFALHTTWANSLYSCLCSESIEKKMIIKINKSIEKHVCTQKNK